MSSSNVSKNKQPAIGNSNIQPAAAQDVSKSEDINQEAEIIPSFEPYEEFVFTQKMPEQFEAIINYETVKEFESDNVEIQKSIYNFSDLLTDSLVNLNYRLNELQQNFQDNLELHKEELQKLYLLVTEIYKAQTKEKSNKQAIDSYLEIPTMTAKDLQKQLSSLQENLENDFVMDQKIAERQVDFVNMLNNRLDALEQILIAQQKSINKNFLNLVILLVLALGIAGFILIGWPLT